MGSWERLRTARDRSASCLRISPVLCEAFSVQDWGPVSKCLTGVAKLRKDRNRFPVIFALYAGTYRALIGIPFRSFRTARGGTHLEKSDGCGVAARFRGLPRPAGEKAL